MSPILTKYWYESIISSDQSLWQRKYGMRGEIFYDILWDKKAPKFGATIMHGGNWIYIAYHYNPKLKPLIRSEASITHHLPQFLPFFFFNRFYMFDFSFKKLQINSSLSPFQSRIRRDIFLFYLFMKKKGNKGGSKNQFKSSDVVWETSYLTNGLSLISNKVDIMNCLNFRTSENRLESIFIVYKVMNTYEKYDLSLKIETFNIKEIIYLFSIA